MKNVHEQENSLFESGFDLDNKSLLPFQPTPIFFNAGSTPTAPATAAAVAPGATLITGSSGFKINLVWDSTVVGSSAFQNAAMGAAQTIANLITDQITVNIGITNSGTGGGAGAGPTTGLYESYASVLSKLSGTFKYLPAGTSVQSQSSVAVWNAQLKLWGWVSPTATALDASATFATDIDPNYITGVVLHELHHALGGVPYGSAPDVFDLFRFTAPGKMLFSSSIPSQTAYFSIDGGITKLAYFGISSDPSDFYNGIPTGGSQTVYNTSRDAFSEFYNPGINGAYQYLTAADLHLMDTLGYHLQPLQTLTDVTKFSLANTTPIIIYDSSQAIVGALDALNAGINQIYSITQSDAGLALNISAAQSVADQSILMLMGVYEPLKLNILGTANADNIIGVAGTDVINGLEGLNTINLNYHTTSDTMVHNVGVNLLNLDKVTGFLATDNLQLANSSSSLNGLTNLFSGLTQGNNVAVTPGIQAVTGGSAFTVKTNGVDVIDVGGTKTFANVGALIADFATSGTGHTYATFGASVASGSHFLVEYMGTDKGLHIAEITQGTAGTHLATNSSGVDLVDLIGVTTHLNAAHLQILAA